MKNDSLAFLFVLPVLESLPVLLLLAVLSPRTRQGEMLLKLLALVMAGRRASWLELSELSVLLHGRGSPCRGSVSVSELLCRLAPDRLALNLSKQKVFYSSRFNFTVLLYVLTFNPHYQCKLCFLKKKRKKRNKTQTRKYTKYFGKTNNSQQTFPKQVLYFNYSLLKHWQLSFFKIIFTKHETVSTKICFFYLTESSILIFCLFPHESLARKPIKQKLSWAAKEQILRSPLLVPYEQIKGPWMGPS